MRVLLIVLSLSFAFQAQAQDKSKLRQNLESFQRIALAAQMDARCGFLSAPQAMELEWGNETLYDALKAQDKTADMANAIRESAREAATSDRFACDANFAELTRNALPESRALLGALDQPAYDPQASYPALLSGYLANAAAAAGIMSGCL